jgi:hypothetical protein
MGFFDFLGKSEDGKSSVWDTLSDVADVASKFVPQASIAKGIFDTIDDAIDPDTDSEDINDVGVVEIIKAAAPSIGNSLTDEKVEKISNMLNVASDVAYAIDSGSTLGKTLDMVNEIVDPNNKEDTLTNDELIGMLGRLTKSGSTTLNDEKLAAIINIIES